MAVRERFIWPVYIILVLMGGYMVNFLFITIPKSWLKKIIVTIFILSFSLPRLLWLKKNINASKGFYTMSQNLNKIYPAIYGNIAGNMNINVLQYIAYYLKCNSYGIPQKGINADELHKQLLENNINYYFVWSKKNEKVPRFLSEYKEISDGKFSDLRIYKIRR
jgi:hypothetical protein